MTKRLLLLSLLVLLSGAPRVHAQSAPLYVNCIAATSTQCNTAGNPGNGVQGDDAWFAFGKLNLDVLALQPPSPQFSVVYSNGSSFGGLLPLSTGIWCLQWTNLSSPPVLSACTGGGGITSIGLSMPSVFTVTGSPLSANGTLAVTANGTAGGIPFFDSATTMASSALLTADQLVLGGGTSAPFTLGSRGTTTTVLHGNAAGFPSFGALNLATDTTGITQSPNGGTGVNNGASTLTLGGNVTFSGAFAATFVIPGTGTYTMPAAGNIGTLEWRLNNQTGNYPVVIGDNGKLLVMTCASPCTVTIPAWSVTPMPGGACIGVFAAGASAVTVHVNTDPVKFIPTGGTGDRTVAPNGLGQFCNYSPTGSSATWLEAGAGSGVT